jgi:uncharacterized protein YndB with AHSA1/START domain
MIEVKHQVDAVRRTVGGRTLAAGEARVSTISQAYDTDLDDLWEAVTSPDRIARWFLPVEGELREGGRYQLVGHAGGTISRCDRPHSFDATWEYGGDVSWITVRLTAEGAGRTRVELEHVAHVADEFWERFGPGATGIGWDMCLYGLANHLSDPGWVPDPEAIAAWLGSADGRTMLRLSSDAWAAAAVADGEDPAVARERADRAFGAYTGE